MKQKGFTMTVDSGTAKEYEIKRIFNSAFKGKKNHFTARVEAYGEKGDCVYEISSGPSMYLPKPARMYGLTVLTNKGGQTNFTMGGVEEYSEILEAIEKIPDNKDLQPLSEMENYFCSYGEDASGTPFKKTYGDFSKMKEELMSVVDSFTKDTGDSRKSKAFKKSLEVKVLNYCERARKGTLPINENIVLEIKGTNEYICLTNIDKDEYVLINKRQKNEINSSEDMNSKNETTPSSLAP